ncbi:uncharacterized protein Z520_10177 [Fonsecaea multimorphosa CBS 102226]|uniref:Cytokinesis regulator n=1 Tax=Fonsecaea multimorphosa CBS 102226 TaxID=1442371 RepID=A0A0D2IAG8_9EURO|nr:uncharacterized protein Z520_10177 [Fonsecaea multimorphosa CBS 102226]KIX94151.1 hypothetical protein Z520_10177 [Fonsecaea multimorphosa CBS 102226]OAL19504.1 hypothetical protein AYO22_09666 [Fonsecaea multimorphosa]
MEQLTLKQRTPVESPEVENWDDDDFENLEDVHFRTASTATSVISHPQTHRRDSVSSRMSLRSESNQGDENWDVLVDEQASIKDAVALAKSKGIPLPTNIPRSALEGGTIRRLKGKEIKKAIADDWSEDLDLPGTDMPLKLAKHDERDLSESLRQISAAFRTSPKTPEAKDMFDQTIRSPKSRSAAMPITLDAFRDTDEDAGFADVPTIKVAKHRSPQKPLLFRQPPTPAKPETENIEDDLELPSDGQLRLSTRKPPPSTPQQSDDFDLEWAEGSLGTRNAGTRRGGRSARSSSASALSPSVSSAFTAESEDEGLEGLVLPDGPIQFEDKLKRRQHEQPSEPPRSIPDHKDDSRTTAGKDDFFSGLEIGDGEVFDAAKLTLNRNVKHKSARPSSPSKRTTTTLNFTSTKSQGTISRLPRFQPAHDRLERARSNLEPVSETGAAISSYQRANSRLGNHASHSSVSAIPAPQPPSTPSTPSRRLLRGTDSRPDLRYEPPTTTTAQLLRAKRSMPVMRGLNSPTKASPYVRPPSRQETGSRLNIPSRPKTPTDRAESRIGEPRKGAIPFLPAGASAGQSQHVSIKNHYRGQGSDGSGDSMSAAQRSLSRLAGLGRPETPGRGIDPARGRSNLTPAELAAQAKKSITKPTRRRNYGDGTELEIFDDLPTSATLESKFTKAPVGRGAPRSLRSKLGLSHLNPSTSSLASTRRGSDTPVPATPLSPAPRSDFPTTALNTTNVPRFARDTAASRNAREQRQISSAFQNMRGEPLQPISTNWKSNSAAIRPSNQGSLRKKRSEKVQLKPHLIKPMGNDVNRAKTEKGMNYNPLLFRWEGNENDLAPFDVPDFYPRGGSPGIQGRGSPGTKAQVALISNVGSSVTGVQVVGGMVFDPSQMRWLKIAENPDGSVSSVRGGSVQIEEEEDVFAGLEDLKEEDETRSRSGTLQNMSNIEQSRDSFGDAEAGHSSGDEWGIGVSEEFDVGPEFVRRQRGEEERWRRKVEKWLRKGLEVEEEEGPDGRGGWRWAIRELVMEQGEA